MIGYVESEIDLIDASTIKLAYRKAKVTNMIVIMRTLLLDIFSLNNVWYTTRQAFWR